MLTLSVPAIGTTSAFHPGSENVNFSKAIAFLLFILALLMPAGAVVVAIERSGI